MSQTNQLEDIDVVSDEFSLYVDGLKFLRIKTKAGNIVDIEKPKIIHKENESYITGTKDEKVDVYDVDTFIPIGRGQKPEKEYKKEPKQIKNKEFVQIDERKGQDKDKDKKDNEEEDQLSSLAKDKFKAGKEGYLWCFGNKKEFMSPCKRCIDQMECKAEFNKEEKKGRLKASIKEEKKRDRKFTLKSLFSLNAWTNYIQGHLENFFMMAFVDLLAISLLAIVGKCLYWILWMEKVISPLLCVPLILTIAYILSKVEMNTTATAKEIYKVFEQYNDKKTQNED